MTKQNNYHYGHLNNMIGVDVVQWFSDTSGAVAVFFISMLPISELRGAIPAGIGVWGMPWWQAAGIAIVGNILPVVFILWLIEPVSLWLRKRFRVFDRFFEWLFARTRRKFYNNYEKWGDLALVIFVAIPLPVTGAWTGSLASWLFGIKPKKALPLIATGVIIAAGIVTALSLGLFSFL